MAQAKHGVHPEANSGGLTPQAQQLIRKHLLIGWSSLLLFLTLGIALELLHAFKLPYYLDARHTTRRLMWTLAHSHGTLFSLIQLAFVATLVACDRYWGERSLGEAAAARVAELRRAGQWLTAALTVMPLGFFWGGVGLRAGDPSLGILLVPIGAVCLLIGVAATTWTLRKSWGSATPSAGKGAK